MALLSPDKLLPLLLGAAVGAGGIIQGLHWRRAAGPAGAEELENQLRIATEENAALKRENESLRSLAQGGGEMPVPQEFIDRVEQDLSLDFLSSPVIHRIAGEELRDRIGAAVESRFGPAGIDDREEAYTLLGWLAGDHPLLPELTAVQAVGVRGWFDEVSGEGWVTDRFRIEDVPDQAALVRLLTRILLHQHFPPSPAYPGDDADRARVALHQGTAAGSEARYYAACARAIGFVPMKQDAEAVRTFGTLAPFVRNLSLFAATAGKGYADALYVKGSGPLLAAFRNPPQTTRAILQPATPPAAPPPLELPPVVAPDDPTGGDYLSESAGELGLRLWLDPAGESPTAAGLAAHWVNDRYQLFADGETGVAVIWEIELASPEAVDRLLPPALARLAALAGAAAPATPGVALTTPGGRHLLLSRPAPGRLRILNTATPETAAKWK